MQTPPRGQSHMSHTWVANSAPTHPGPVPTRVEWEWQKTEMQNEQHVLKDENEGLKADNDRLMVMLGELAGGSDYAVANRTASTDAAADEVITEAHALGILAVQVQHSLVQ